MDQFYRNIGSNLQVEAVFVEDSQGEQTIPVLLVEREGVMAFSYDGFVKKYTRHLEEEYDLVASDEDSPDYWEMLDSGNYFVDWDRQVILFPISYPVPGYSNLTRLTAVVLGKKQMIHLSLIFPESQLDEHAELMEDMIDSFEFDEGYEFRESTIHLLAKYGDSLQIIINMVLFMILISLGFFVGTFVEKRHYGSIRERERKLLHMPAVPMDLKTLLNGQEVDVKEAYMVSGSVVLSEDYFKGFLAGLKSYFGGNLTSYESLLDRARREATLRMKEQALGADMIVCTRFETTTIGRENPKDRGTATSIEVLCYGTAITLKK